MSKHTVVMHSGAGYGGKQGFTRGLESRTLDSKKQEDLVRKVGGLIFNSYNEAEDYCMKEMYPANYNGLHPRAPGTFSKCTVDGLRIYVPVPPGGAPTAPVEPTKTKKKPAKKPAKKKVTKKR